MLLLKLFLIWYLTGFIFYLVYQRGSDFYTKGNLITLFFTAVMGLFIPLIVLLEEQHFSWWDEPLFKKKAK